MTDRSRLGPRERAEDLERMRREEFDVVIVGGGVTGVGAALDAATRGLSVALVEQRDWAAGTSSRSSKLIHGGLRYLEQLEFGLVREAKHEQTLMLQRLCPHLVRPVPFIYPLQQRVFERAYVGAGIALYDLVGGAKAVPWHRHLGRRQTLSLFPGLDPKQVRGGIQYWDGLVDDARHTLAIARTARVHGAAMASSMRCVGFSEVGSRVTGVHARCLESGETIHLRAKQIVNATGVWTDQVQSLAGRGRIHVRASKGIHIVVPRDRIHGDSGLILRTKTSVLFVIPWKTHWIIGTTDTDWNLDLDHPAASRRDIDYLLDTVNEMLASPLTHDDIEGVYAGLRPLLLGEDESTSQLSRTHAVSQSVSGLITVAGGKYTTYRVMAKDAIDLAARGLPHRVPPSCTETIPLIGAPGVQGFYNGRERVAEDLGLHVHSVEHLISRHGSRIQELARMMQERPELREPIPGAAPYLKVEALYAASHEGALHLDDVLTRRTRISIETFDRGLEAAPHVAALMAEVLGWDEETTAREITHYEARVTAERDSQAQPDDRTADAARVGAPDVRRGGAPGTADVVDLGARRT